MLRIEMLPARHGDCLWVEWGHPDRPRRLLVDGGPARSYQELRRRIATVPSGHRRFELVVCTHIDTDHIDGIIQLLRDRELGAEFGDVWFNGWPQIAAEEPDEQGGKQGEFLGALLFRGGWPWNEQFGGGPVVTRERESLPVVDVEGLTVTVLAPGPEELRRLEDEWVDALRDEEWVAGDVDRALAELEQRRDLKIPPPLDELGDEDPSIPNRSSITLLVEHRESDGRVSSCLLTGDAHADVLERALEALLRERGLERLPLGGLKLPHHGSRRNLSRAVLDLLDCRRYLVSSNGDVYKHPHGEAIELILEHHEARRARPEICFNYASPFTNVWLDPDRQAERRYRAIAPAGLDVWL